jgi:death-on-curing protein
MARPYNGYYRAIEKKAAALVQSIAGNHGFADGNKRTAVILTHLLLSKSGYRSDPIHGDDTIDVAMENMVVDAVCHKLEFDEIVRWFVDRLSRPSAVRKA